MTESSLSDERLKQDVTIIQPTSGWKWLDLRELWQYRELLYFLVWRDVKVRYKQTLLGAGWAILQPFMTMVIFSIFFGRLAGIPSDGVPYPIFIYSGLLPWQLLENGASKAGTSLVASRSLLTKVYFPRLTMPMAPVFGALVDFGLASLIFIAMMFYYGVQPSLAILFLPFFMLLTLLTSTGVGTLLSALNVNYRDIGYVTPFLFRLWFFLTPITYPLSLVPEQFRFLYSLNPMVGVVEGFRWALLGDRPPPTTEMLLITTIMSLTLFLVGIFYFRNMERSFADVV